jgi:hypothetical protein
LVALHDVESFLDEVDNNGIQLGPINITLPVVEEIAEEVPRLP